MELMREKNQAANLQLGEKLHHGKKSLDGMGDLQIQQLFFAHLKLPHLSFANDEIGDTVR